MRSLRAELEGLTIKDEKGRIHVTDPETVDKALKLIELYAAYYERYTEHVPRVSKLSIPHFYRAVALAAEYGITLEELVARQFKSMSRYGIFRANCIDSKNMLEASLKSSDIILDELGRYKANIELYNSRTKLYGSELALRDSTNEFSPLFRAVMAHKLGLKEVVSAYYDAALVEYRTTPIAKEVFAGELGFFHPADVS